jgi:hypothetical protein
MYYLLLCFYYACNLGVNRDYGVIFLFWKKKD